MSADAARLVAEGRDVATQILKVFGPNAWTYARMTAVLVRLADALEASAARAEKAERIAERHGEALREIANPKRVASGVPDDNGMRHCPYCGCEDDCSRDCVTLVAARAIAPDVAAEHKGRAAAPGDNPDLVARVVAERDALRADVERLTRERDEALKERGALRQRVGQAEKASRVTIEECRRQGVSLGRALAVEGVRLAEAERDALAASLAKLLAAFPEFPDEPAGPPGQIGVLIRRDNGITVADVRQARRAARACEPSPQAKTVILDPDLGRMTMTFGTPLVCPWCAPHPEHEGACMAHANRPDSGFACGCPGHAEGRAREDGK